MNCPRCQRAKLVRIDLELQGEPVRLHSCSACDSRWWVRSGEQISLDGVLELATVRR
jgi:transposase-like protein